MNFCVACGLRYKLGSTYCGGCGASGALKPGLVRSFPPPVRHQLQTFNANGNVGQWLIVAAGLTVACLMGPRGILTLVAGAWIYGFVQGFRNRVVLFFDTKDALIAFGCLAACFVATCLAVKWLVAPATMWQVAAATMSAVAAAMGWWTVRNAVHYNRNVVAGAMVTIFKLTFGLAWIATLLNGLGVASDSKRKTIDRVQALGLVALLVWFMTRLINGKEVYKARGWTAP